MNLSQSNPEGSTDLPIVTPPESCEYLHDEFARYEVRLINRLSASQYDEMLRRGWRRQGIYFFRPSCDTCNQCKSLRVPVDIFRPSKSQRRSYRRNEQVRVEIGEPSISDNIIQLFNDYHDEMTRRRGWRTNQVDLADFVLHFHTGEFPFAREFRYYRENELIGLGLVDITDESASSIYFFHAPSWRSQAPGVFSLMSEFEHLKTLNVKHHYLGYWIASCPSMAYKYRYRPHEILETYVGDSSPPIWSPIAAHPSHVTKTADSNLE